MEILLTSSMPGSWELPSELVQLQEIVRDFVKKEVLPAEEHLEDYDSVRLPKPVLEGLQAKARTAGLWCVASPAEYGGGDFSLLAQSIIAEEAAQCRLGAYVPAAGAFGGDPPNVIFAGTKDQIERYAVPTIEKGEKTFVAISEPGGGSDPARSIETTATKVDGGWLLNGTKFWITGADTSRWGVTFARTSPGMTREGISCFIVETDSPGITIRPIPVIRSWYPCEVNFQDYFVPEENLLGEEGKGFTLTQAWLVNGRVPYAAVTVGVAQAALNLAVEYAKNRVAFDSRLAQKQAIQWMLADSEMELRAARLIVYQAAWKADLGQEFKTEASIAKVVATETAGRVIDRCVQILGGMGVAKEMPLERWYREIRIKRIGEGPSEVHRMVVARHLLGKSMKA